MSNGVRVLLVEDSVADATLIIEVMDEQGISVDLTVVRDGEDAMAYLLKQHPHAEALSPHLILLDLNLPKKDGREVLAEIKSNPALSLIPVVILTTSQSQEDILKSYSLQASCYVTKPIDLEQFSITVKSINDFWFSSVRFPLQNAHE